MSSACTVQAGQRAVEAAGLPGGEDEDSAIGAHQVVARRPPRASRASRASGASRGSRGCDGIRGCRRRTCAVGVGGLHREGVTRPVLETRDCAGQSSGGAGLFCRYRDHRVLDDRRAVCHGRGPRDHCRAISCCGRGFPGLPRNSRWSDPVRGRRGRTCAVGVVSLNRERVSGSILESRDRAGEACGGAGLACRCRGHGVLADSQPPCCCRGPGHLHLLITSRGGGLCGRGGGARGRGLDRRCRRCACTAGAVSRDREGVGRPILQAGNCAGQSRGCAGPACWRRGHRVAGDGAACCGRCPENGDFAGARDDEGFGGLGRGDGGNEGPGVGEVAPPDPPNRIKFAVAGS